MLLLLLALFVVGVMAKTSYVVVEDSIGTTVQVRPGDDVVLVKGTAGGGERCWPDSVRLVGQNTRQQRVLGPFDDKTMLGNCSVVALPRLKHTSGVSSFVFRTSSSTSNQWMRVQFREPDQEEEGGCWSACIITGFLFVFVLLATIGALCWFIIFNPDENQGYKPVRNKDRDTL